MCDNHRMIMISTETIFDEDKYSWRIPNVVETIVKYECRACKEKKAHTFKEKKPVPYSQVAP